MDYLDATKAGLLTHLLSDGGPVNVAYHNYDWSVNSWIPKLIPSSFSWFGHGSVWSIYNRSAYTGEIDLLYYVNIVDFENPDHCGPKKRLQKLKESIFYIFSF